MGRAGIEPATPGFSVLCPDSARPKLVKALRPPDPVIAAPAQRAGRVEAPTPPPDLAAVVAAWPTLPEAIKAGILAMVRASSPS